VTRRAAAILFTLFVLAAAAAADVIADDRKRVTPCVRFDKLGDYPDYESFLAQQRGRSGPP
jgi:hypothetical protein